MPRWEPSPSDPDPYPVVRRTPARSPSRRGRSRRSISRSVSSRWTRWVTSRQKSSIGPRTMSAASSGPAVHGVPVGHGQLHAHRPRRDGRRFRTAKPNGMALNPIIATCRSLGVGSLVTPSASATSWPCAQVSISRAVTKDAPTCRARTRAAGPGSTARRTPRCCGPGRAEPVEQLVGRRARGGAASRSSSARGEVARAPPRGNARDRSPGGAPASSNQARWLIWSRTAQPSAGCGELPVCRRPGAVIRRRARAVSARRSASNSSIRSTAPAQSG